MSGPQESPTFYSLKSETSSVQFMTELLYFKRVLISGCGEYVDSLIEKSGIRIPNRTAPRFYRASLSLEAPNYCLCIQSNSAGFSFVNTGKQGKQVHLKHARRHFERNLVKDVHHRSVASRNWLKSERQGEAELTPVDFFLWGLLKGKVYKNTPRTIDQLKEIQAVNVDTLGKVFQNLEKRILMCLEVKGDQFQHSL